MEHNQDPSHMLGIQPEQQPSADEVEQAAEPVKPEKQTDAKEDDGNDLVEASEPVKPEKQIDAKEEDGDDLMEASEPGFSIVDAKFEEFTNPHQAEQRGALKSFTALADGAVWHYSGKDTDFTVLVELQLIAHGWEDENKQQPMTLLILHYNLHAPGRGSWFSSVLTRIDFGNQVGSEESNPEVVLWAPFKSRVRYDESEAERHVETHVEAELGGGGGGVDAKASAGHTDETSWKVKYFANCESAPRRDKKDEQEARRNGVEWSLKQNELEGHGVSNEFSVAILLNRSSQAPFMVSRFEIRVEAGFAHDVFTGVKRFLGLRPDRTKPFPINPSSTKPDPTQEGKAILKAKLFDVNNLGKLTEPGKLVELTRVWGCEPED